MIRIKPLPTNDFICPVCHSKDVHLIAVRVPGMTMMADCRCENCHQEFYTVLPAGHTSDKAIHLNKVNGKLMEKENPDWLNTALQTSTYMQEGKVSIRKHVYHREDKVILLNALDYIYGHALLKLLNASHHLNYHRDYGLIILAPYALEWMIPRGTAEAWIVDLKLNDLKSGHRAIDEFVQEQMASHEEVFVSKAFSHPDFTQINLRRFTGISPFDLRSFSSSKPVVTFILREDRWWFASPLQYWFYRACRKLKKMKWGSRILAKAQLRLVISTIIALKKAIPDVDIFVAGLGKSGSIAGYAKDLRSTSITASTEKSWCALYARSHVVVGVHGSNMLLPTAFAAGCLEILPEDRYGNMVQDIAVRYNDRRQLFLYRFTDQYTSSSVVARKLAAMLNDYEHYTRNMVTNVYERKSKTRDESLHFM